MKVKDAYKKIDQKDMLSYGSDGHYFALIGWKSPSSGSKHGPYLITVTGDTAIEIGFEGQFVNAFSSNAEHYFPWKLGTTLEKSRETLQKIIKQLEDRVGRIDGKENS